MNALALPRRISGRLRDSLERLARNPHRLDVFLSVLIGAVVGLVVVAFILLTGRLAARMYPAGVAPWRRLLVPTVGSLTAGWLLFRYFPLARGSGIPQTKFALYVAHGVISLRTVLGKFACCAVSLASGIALGREGPSVQIGAGVASVIGRSIGLGQERVQALIPVGGAAALAAAFNTPIAAVLFSLEEIVGDLHAPVLGTVVLSAATAWMILHLFLGDAPLFRVSGYQLVHPGELAAYAVLGVLGGIASGTFVRLLLALRARFLRFDQRLAWLHPVAGGLAVGLLGLAVPEVLGVGYDYVERVLNGDVVLSALILLAVLKIVATALCYASGNAGGVFGPSLFIGAMVGGAVGTAAHAWFPASTASPGAYALVGMGTAFAGIVRTPLASVIMIFELTRDYAIVVPLMVSNLIAFYVSQRLQRVPIYEAIALQDGVHLPAGESRGYRGARVADAMRPAAAALGPETRIGPAAAHVRAAGIDAVPVVEGTAVFIVRDHELDAAMAEGLGDEPITALRPVTDPEAQAHGVPPHLHPDHSLSLALERMRGSGRRLLPVVSRADVRRVVGMLSFDDVVSSFDAPRPPEAAMEAERAIERAPALAPRLLRTVTAAVGVALALASADVWLVRAEAAETRADAARRYGEGRELAAHGDAKAAIARFRSALSVAPQDSEVQLALARALLADGRGPEARTVTEGVLGREGNSGEANLLMARIEAGLGDPDSAEAHYHRAMLGRWPPDARGAALAARIELVDFLTEHGPRERLLAELPPLDDLVQGGPLARRIARLYLTAGAPERSRDLWLRLRRAAPNDPEILVGIAEADLARHDYGAAQANFRAAHRLKPDDPVIEARLSLCEDVLNLDPTRRGLTAAARYDRSVRLVALAGESLARCPTTAGAASTASRATPKPPTGVEAVNAATDANMDLAEDLWRTRVARCGGAARSPADERLAMVLTRTAR